MSAYLLPADILLPDFEKTEGHAWSVVACDQYTSEPEYWEEVESTVGDKPSTLRLILPEVHLSESNARVPQIHSNMEAYLKDVLVRHPNSMLYLEREQSRYPAACGRLR